MAYIVLIHRLLSDVSVIKENNCFQDLKHEAERINNINILVCTPGRLLQHMDETICFHATDLQMLGKSNEYENNLSLRSKLS